MQFTDLVAGSYHYEVREQSGCSIIAADSIELTVDCVSGCGSLIADAHTFQDATCGSQPDGSAIIDVTGGSSPYEYSLDGIQWAPFISGNVIANLPPNGTYNIVVRQDSLNASCRDVVSVTINGPSPITLAAPIVTVDQASCNQFDGSVKISQVLGGLSPYNYQIDGSFITLPSDSIVTGLAAGAHIFTVIDASGCSEDFSFDVDSPGLIMASMTAVPVSCTSIFLKAGIRIQVDLDSTTLPGPYIGLCGVNCR